MEIIAAEGEVVCVELGRREAIAAALHMIAVACGDEAARAAERAVAPFVVQGVDHA